MPLDFKNISMKQQELGRWRKKFFPIYNHEVKKVLFLNALMFFTTFTYSWLRVLKDAYLQTLKGVDLITAVKLFWVIPFMVGFKFGYDFVAKRVSYNGRMYGLLGYFFAVFAIFYFCHKKIAGIDIYDQREVNMIPKGGVAFIGVVWPYILFYVHAEAFGSFVLSVGFWGFANRITASEQAKRCYTTFSIGAGVSTILAGALGLWMPSVKGENQDFRVLVVLVAIIAIVVIYFVFTKDINKNPETYQIPDEKKIVKKKLGFVDSIKAFLKSDQIVYLGLLCMLVGGYNAAIGMFELTYKDLINKFGADESNGKFHFTNWMGNMQLVLIGVSSLVLVFFLAIPVTKKGWRFTALLVPCVLLVGLVVFCGCLLKIGYQSILVDRKMWVLYVGLAVVVFVKSTKYVFFDSTKEAAYIPLDAETKVTGKSFVDGVVGRLGKASSSAYGQMLSFLGFKILDANLVTSVILFGVVLCWIYGVFKLNDKYTMLLNESKIESEEKVK